MDYFDNLRYCCRMSMSKTATLDPVACCGSVRTDVLDPDRRRDTRPIVRRAVRSDPAAHALGDRRRGGEEVCACDLVELSGRSQPTVSHHMKILVDAGLVAREKRGLWVWYRIEPTRLDALRTVLT